MSGVGVMVISIGYKYLLLIIETAYVSRTRQALSNVWYIFNLVSSIEKYRWVYFFRVIYYCIKDKANN